MESSDKIRERFRLCTQIVRKMRRCTEINIMLDNYSRNGNLGVSKSLAEVKSEDMSLSELTFIVKNYPTYKSRKLKKIESETDPDRKKELLKEFDILSRQLDNARAMIKSL